MSAAFFRASVAACVTDGAGAVLACRRRGAHDGAWQVPQGGIEADEDPEQALWRELREEVGLRASDLRIERVRPDWLAYELPVAFRGPKTGLGQVQKWFLLASTVPSLAIELDGVEFDDWRWLTPVDLVDRAVAFRRPTYEAALRGFGLLSR